MTYRMKKCLSVVQMAATLARCGCGDSGSLEDTHRAPSARSPGNDAASNADKPTTLEPPHANQYVAGEQAHAERADGGSGHLAARDVANGQAVSGHAVVAEHGPQTTAGKLAVLSPFVTADRMTDTRYDEGSHDARGDGSESPAALVDALLSTTKPDKQYGILRKLQLGAPLNGECARALLKWWSTAALDPSMDGAVFDMVAKAQIGDAQGIAAAHVLRHLPALAPIGQAERAVTFASDVVEELSGVDAAAFTAALLDEGVDLAAIVHGASAEQERVLTIVNRAIGKGAEAEVLSVAAHVEPFYRQAPDVLQSAPI
jgi:hypothetical protein